MIVFIGGIIIVVGFFIFIKLFSIIEKSTEVINIAKIAASIVRDAKPEELILKNIGQVAVGSKKIVVKENDVALIKLSIQLTINDVDYSVYNDAVGKKFQILATQFGYSTILVFRKEI